MSIPNLFPVTDRDIRKLLYLPDDRKVAEYLSIAPNRVAKVRAAQPKIQEHYHREVRESPGTLGSSAVDRQSAIAGSAGLLRSLLRYGLKHDGLPGLSAPQFFARCREADVAVRS